MKNTYHLLFEKVNDNTVRAVVFESLENGGMCVHDIDEFNNTPDQIRRFTNKWYFKWNDEFVFLQDNINFGRATTIRGKLIKAIKHTLSKETV